MKRVVITLSTLLACTAGLVLSSGCAGTMTRESTGEYLDDAAITARVKTAYVRDPVVGAMDVKVETFKSTVQLSGFVNTPEERARAEQIARNVPGVRNVINNITVK